MKINLGDTIESWTVCRIEPADSRSRDEDKLVWLLTLERALDGVHDPVTGITQDVLVHETRRTWVFEDEEVTL